jgi:hypothetical protein
MGKLRNVYKILVRKPEDLGIGGRIVLGRILEGGIWEGVAQDRYRWAPVNTVMILQVP